MRIQKRNLSNLFSPIRIGEMDLSHRVVFAPCTRMRADANLIPTDLMAEYYQQRSKEPGTFLVTEATMISLKTSGLPAIPGIWSNQQIDRWAKVFEAIHDNHSYGYLQLGACGRSANLNFLKKWGIDFTSCSGVALKHGPSSKAAPRALTKSELDEYTEDYAKAAQNAMRAGADGVEIHACNGYLLDEFLHENTNQRSDEYGGSIENRSRFPLQVLDAVIDEVGPENTAIRFSPWATSHEMDIGVSPIPQYSHIITEIEKRAQEGNKIAYLHIIEPRVDGAGDSKKFTDSHATMNTFARTIWSGPLIRSGGLIDAGQRLADADDQTLIAYGRHFISNPDLVKRLENNLPLTKYDRNTFYVGGAKGYTNYPFSD